MNVASNIVSGLPETCVVTSRSIRLKSDASSSVSSLRLADLQDCLDDINTIESILSHTSAYEREEIEELLTYAVKLITNMNDSADILAYLHQLWRNRESTTSDTIARDGNDRSYWLHFIDSPVKLSRTLIDQFQGRLVDCFGHRAQLLGEQYWVQRDNEVVFLLNIVYEDTSLYDQCKKRYVPIRGWTIYNVCLSSELRGKRLAKPFMQAIVEEFQKRHLDANEIYLTVYADNTAAIRLYKSLGFEKVDFVCEPKRLDIMRRIL